MMWGYYYNSPGMFVWMIISSLIWLGLIGVAVWALVRWVGSRAPGSTPPSTATTAGPSAQEILRQRFARGEIDQATFERMQAAVDGSAAREAQRDMVTDGSRAP